MEPYTPALIAAFTSLLVFWLSVPFALRRFYREKWWEKKFAAYASVIEALHQMKKDADVRADALGCGRELTPERSQELTSAYKMGRDEILRLADVGEFLFCDETVKLLRGFPTELANVIYRSNSAFDQCEEVSALIIRHLADVKRLAKKDLGVTGFWLFNVLRF